MINDRFIKRRLIKQMTFYHSHTRRGTVAPLEFGPFFGRRVDWKGKEEKLGAYGVKRVNAGAHLPNF